MWWTLAWQNRTSIGLGLIALVVALYIGVLKTEIHFLKGKLESTNVELAQTNVSLSLEKAKTARWQTALETVSADGKRKSANASMWKSKYEDSVKQYQKLVGGLVSWTPNPGEDECLAAKRLLKDYRR